MRDFSWKYFAMTGDVDAYLLYKLATDNENTAEQAAAAEEMNVDEEAD
ncbi:YqzL family protein [Paenibacillus sediminis]|uniref:YqzL family protein n=1 Tax=Paenibacillus sediminis TaxID=664909 RepID=A0ABS4GYV3_9BACL|nr:YqzL family protein [Paenibacillus sediminis]MBP1935406.1 hypothetical protein [Paenibacillus sediminis]